MKEHMYTATNTFDCNYTFMFEGKDYTTKVSGDLEHAMLREGMRQFQVNYLKGCGKGQSTLNSVNLMNVSIGIVHSDAYLDEGDPGDFEFTSYSYTIASQQKKHLFSTTDLFDPEFSYNQANISPNKAKRNTKFNNHLKQHIINANIDDIHDIYTSKTNIDSECESSQFHESFHHTEQGLAHSLYETKSKEMICRWIKQLKNTNSIVALFIDGHTIRPMCPCCNIGLIGLQNSKEHGFMAKLIHHMNSKFEDEAFAQLPDDGLTLHTRISCTKHPSRDSAGLHKELDKSLKTVDKPGTTLVTFSYERPRQVIQGYADTGELDKIITDEDLYKQRWNEDIFVSRAIPDKRYDTLMNDKTPKLIY